jgi:hypothetical protein
VSVGEDEPEPEPELEGCGAGGGVGGGEDGALGTDGEEETGMPATVLPVVAGGAAATVTGGFVAGFLAGL